MTPANDLRGSDSREYDFYNDPELSTIDYVNGLVDRMPDFEPASIEAEIDQVEAYANDANNHARIAEATNASLYEAQLAALTAERREAAENLQLVAIGKQVGQWINFERDYEVADNDTKRGWGLSA